jgi:hypothetical protein
MVDSSIAASRPSTGLPVPLVRQQILDAPLLPKFEPCASKPRPIFTEGPADRDIKSFQPVQSAPACSWGAASLIWQICFPDMPIGFPVPGEQRSCS